MPKKFASGAWSRKHDRELIMLAKTDTLQAIADRFDRPVTTVLN
jgi:hypothetical protein